MQDTEKDPHCSPLSINLVNSQLNQLENDLFGKIITIKSYFMEEIHSIHPKFFTFKGRIC